MKNSAERRFCLWVAGFCVLLSMHGLAEKPAMAGEDGSFGKLTIYSEVPNADIYVDAKYLGQDHVTLSSIPAGKHYLRVIKDGWTFQSGVVEVANGEETIIVAKPIEQELQSKKRKPNYVFLFGGLTAVGYNVTAPSVNINFPYQPQAGVGTEIKFALPLVDFNVDLGFSLNYPSAVSTGTTEAQLAISSPYVCVSKDIINNGNLKFGAGVGLNYGIFNPGGGTSVSVASRLGYQLFLEGMKNIGDNQKFAVRIGYVNYSGRTAGGGNVSSAGYGLQTGIAYQL